jgi:GrpB-like predicted nucleotidyltransferase (UPF0157 family)
MTENKRQTTEDELRVAHVDGEPTRLDGRVVLVEYDPEWPRLFVRDAERIRAALGDRALMIEHVGSTSVPGLAAKPKIDILLEVADTRDEATYVPALEAAGYVLHIREPGWFEHRLFKGPETDVNLHVFSTGCEEIERMLRFRDHLRANPADRDLYLRTKRELAQRSWQYTQHYADAKSQVVEEILRRASRRT